MVQNQSYLHFGLLTGLENTVFWLAISFSVAARSYAYILAREIPQVPVDEQVKPTAHGGGCGCGMS